MSFDLAALTAAVAAHGTVARVVIAEVAGSSPREVGASLLVWRGGQSGTIGGGALEFAAAARALNVSGFSRHALGPDLGQCCGGAVTLLTEQYTADTLPDGRGQTLVIRGDGSMPLAVKRLIDRARAQGQRPAPQRLQSWMIEPITTPQTHLWIWGAGHVGRAVVDVLHPLPVFALTWIDTAPDRFPAAPPPCVTCLPATDPVRAVSLAPKTAHHLILTYSHEIDLALCHALLSHGFGFAGLIGSDTKWARFRSRLRNLGHSDAEIFRICCPIGQKSLGKHPQAIAVGVAATLLNSQNTKDGATWMTHSSASEA
ncbi:xanthine dehydrogenase accessory protein XdhC [Puniceibacterium sp. IMCC21224]|uniref:xanthine dehydrogenase accessory protein XdhC n=1 Tax=Puniceibacterium sp. IMCC21224 TaxID=1618204 RepID=UPI00064D8914|nr:xanthine dehydrogenase accessory protein XdhC [Puniceibacterium sp. IMCC21224]KMK66099.1 molybdenum cofactor sulfurylase [Puniceibacterium sp. IMCC21224]